MLRFSVTPTTGGVYTIKDNYGELDYLHNFYTYNEEDCKKFCRELNNHLLFEPPFFSTLVGSNPLREEDIKRFVFDNFGFIEGLNVLLLDGTLIITCVSDVVYDEDNLRFFYDLLGLSFYCSSYYMDCRVSYDDVKYVYYIYTLDLCPDF